ncbi:hypothetical protein N7448_008397 [Penicillium atrosanguineum]|uniref:Uncharacterized protein n=1 Tax=Penicillium atrosanguineum TaxID=1132637 RepID=A0A9W9GR28_9EURO|nr:Protein ABC1 [Penicillium atrosanguineum]KAJ5127618.1 hypothetical protein N7448_008397 [Penicillium atrosanguineum]KAJ5147827.1 hypothetical protein N7526_001179 [Penicillium atrosanguineum]KAJ5313702.1 Protein ABC1 [Penicillium atrosanguineum]KAJ5330874.1 hypothetical protein N7476_000657 [Penicillium atrosanguineum]
MDVGSAVDGLLLVLGTLFYLTKRLIYYLLYLLLFLASPLLFLGRGLLSIVLLPLRLLVKFEAILYFMTGAVLTGVTAGLVLYYMDDTLSQLLRLPSTKSEPTANLIEQDDSPFDWETKWRDNYQSSTILEEDEHSQSSENSRD